MKLQVKQDCINLEPEWRDALINGNEHTTVDTGQVTVMVFNLTVEEAKALERKLLEGVEI